MGVVAHFLVVEDDPLVGSSLARLLSAHGQPTVARTVAEAIQMLPGTPWDAVILDLGLPDGSGLDVLAEVRRGLPACPAMVLTGALDADAVNAAHDLTAQFVVKPVDTERIRRFCREATARHTRGHALYVASTNDVPGSLQGCIERLRELLPLRLDPIARHSMGVIVATIKSRPEIYGRGGVGLVATAIGEDMTSLYRYAEVAVCWSQEEVRALCTRRPVDGRALTWSHLVLIGAVADREVRSQLVKRVLSEDLSVRALTSLVGGRRGR